MKPEPQWHRELAGKVLKSSVPPDPIFLMDSGWYYADECWADCFGPFETEGEARTSLKGFCEVLRRERW